MPEGPWELSNPLPTPDGNGEGNAPRWNCPACEGALTVTVDRYTPERSAFWKWAWECCVCRGTWVEAEFAAARKTEEDTNA